MSGDDVADWDRLANKDDPDLLQEYLLRHPRGRFSELARAKLQRMEIAPLPGRKQKFPMNAVIAAIVAVILVGVALIPGVRNSAVLLIGGALPSGQSFRDCDQCPEMVMIPAGNFTMGSPASGPGRFANEGPQRSVSIRAFAVSKYEITFAQWDACVAGGGRPPTPILDQAGERGNRPVNLVSWDDAQDYVQWLSRETRQSYRLLSEAEWEYAARAGTTTAYSTGATISASQAYFDPTHGSMRTMADTHSVGAYAANPFGLHDMHSSVSEWVQDCYARSYLGLPTDGSANESPCGARGTRVHRGGSWVSGPERARSAARDWEVPTDGSSIIGFRIQRTL